MTGLLVSVRDAAEAQLALAGGADLIDLKEPLRGSLGPADLETRKAVLAEVAGQRPVSAALGELLVDPIAELATQSAGLRFIKVGLAGCATINDWPQRWQRELSALPPGVGRVAVAYADYRQANSPTPEATMQFAVQFGCEALLIDTYHKAQCDLFAHLTMRRLRELVRDARRNGLQIVLAGSLSLETIPSALGLAPDFVAVRGAACRASRTCGIDEQRVAELRAALTTSVGTNLRRKVKMPSS